MLIAAKCDIEAKDKYGMRPLLMAAWHGHRDAVRLLITCGANVHAVNRKEYDVVMCAVRNNCVEVVDLLVETLERLDLTARDVEGNGALHHAASAGHAAIVDKLLSLGADPNATNKLGRSPLHLCCEKGHEAVCQLLIGKQGSLEAADHQGNTPLHVTVNNKHSQLAQIILEANTAILDMENSDGMTALHIASSLGCRGIIESLVQCGSDVDKQNKNGNTALHLACAANDLETVELLISKGADLNSLNERLQSPIHIAAEYGYTEICQMLLAAGANIEQKEQGGRTPLYIAARGSFTAIVDMIIKTARLDYPEQVTPPFNFILDRSWATTVELEVNRPREVPHSVRELVRRLAYQQLGPGHWKQLATHWAFTNEQVKAIEHQYTGPCSYKEHGLRMMTIWLEGLGPDVDPMKNLYESLLAINQKRLAGNGKLFNKRHKLQ
ncbi:hypothetical protein AAG570_003917 [Ranatra chinensis]|uniref:Death domain-containing protein n=1 Tax=Ranatra chinensis TaxID=642074 RepID=A0ABD0Y2A0_9HEMI